MLEYPTGDDHPSKAGNMKATAEFVPLLNDAYETYTIPELSPIGILLALSTFSMIAVFLAKRRRN